MRRTNQLLTLWSANFEERINLLANHLITIFAFSVPLFVISRRTSLFLLVVLFLIRGKYWFHIKTHITNPIIAAYLIYFLIHVIWFPFSRDISTAKTVLHDSLFLLYPLLFSTFLDERFRERIFYAYVSGLLVSVFISFLIYFAVINPGEIGWIGGTSSDPSPFHHHSHFGSMLALTSILLLVKAVEIDYTNTRKSILFVVALLFSIDLFLVGGRAGYVVFFMLLVSLFVYFSVTRTKRYRYLAYGGLAASLIFVLAYQFSDIFVQNINETMQSLNKIFVEGYYKSSTGYRIALYRNLFNYLGDNWIFGLGTGYHSELINTVLRENELRSVKNAQFLVHIHNEYLSAFLQFGIVGIASFMYLILSYNLYRADSRLASVSLAMIGLTIAVFSLFDIYVIGLGVILTVTLLSPMFFANSKTMFEKFPSLNFRTLFYYAIAILGFQLQAVML